MTNKSLDQKELLELGKKLQQFYELGYINKRHALLFSFLKGLATGLGAFIGGTIIIGILAWVLSLFNQLPFINQIVDAANRALQK